MSLDKANGIGDGADENVSLEEVDKCIAILDKLGENAHQVLALPEKKRVALLKAAGLLSRPSKHEFKQQKKDAAKAAKRKNDRAR